MKSYISVSALAFAILAAFSIWFGGLNQDEGWYLYAAQLVGEGKMLYRDFFYTQGPLMPIVYAALDPLWRGGGILGARILTCALGFAGMIFFVMLARVLAPAKHRSIATAVAFVLLACNLYHIYYSSIPKTYALASLFVGIGSFLTCFALKGRNIRARPVMLFAGGLSLAFAAGTRISLGALLAVCGFSLLFSFGRYRWSFLWFGLGGALGLLAVYGPFLFLPGAFEGLCAAQKYHAARGGFDLIFTVGSVSRLVRWYLPVFVMLGLGIGFRWSRPDSAEDDDTCENTVALGMVLGGFLAVFAVQMLAPFPYEDYQVPVMGLLAAGAAALSARLGSPLVALLALGMTFASSFGSPLLEKWMVAGQDRFWSIKKEKCELAQLREVARMIESIDPDGKELLTQDLYLAIETGRKVPAGLEMGPFSILSDEEWRTLLSTTEAPIAALSGYTFAIEPPRCEERPLEQQNEYWRILRDRYDFALREEGFGQNSTPLLILQRKKGGEE